MELSSSNGASNRLYKCLTSWAFRIYSYTRVHWSMCGVYYLLWPAIRQPNFAWSLVVAQSGEVQALGLPGRYPRCSSGATVELAESTGAQHTSRTMHGLSLATPECCPQAVAAGQ